MIINGKFQQSRGCCLRCFCLDSSGDGYWFILVFSFAWFDSGYMYGVAWLRSTIRGLFWEMTSRWMKYSALNLVRQWIQVSVSLRRLVSVSIYSAMLVLSGICYASVTDLVWWSMPCRSCSMPVVVLDKCPCFRSCRISWRCRSCSFFTVVASLCSCSEVLCAVTDQGPRILLDFLCASGGVRSWC